MKKIFTLSILVTLLAFTVTVVKMDIIMMMKVIVVAGAWAGGV